MRVQEADIPFSWLASTNLEQHFLLALLTLKRDKSDCTKADGETDSGKRIVSENAEKSVNAARTLCRNLNTVITMSPRKAIAFAGILLFGLWAGSKLKGSSSPSASPSPSASVTRSATPSPTASPSPQASASPAASPAATVAPAPSATPVASPSPAASRSVETSAPSPSASRSAPETHRIKRRRPPEHHSDENGNPPGEPARRRPAPPGPPPQG